MLKLLTVFIKRTMSRDVQLQPADTVRCASGWNPPISRRSARKLFQHLLYIDSTFTVHRQYILWQNHKKQEVKEKNQKLRVLVNYANTRIFFVCEAGKISKMLLPSGLHKLKVSQSGIVKNIVCGGHANISNGQERDSIIRDKFSNN